MNITSKLLLFKKVLVTLSLRHLKWRLHWVLSSFETWKNIFSPCHGTMWQTAVIVMNTKEIHDCTCEETMNFSWAVGEMDLQNCIPINRILSATSMIECAMFVCDLIYFSTATGNKWNTLAKPIAMKFELWNTDEKRRSSFLYVEPPMEIEVVCWECWHTNPVLFSLLCPKLDVGYDLLGGSIRNRQVGSNWLTTT